METRQLGDSGDQIVFVYGTLRRGWHHHGLLAEARFLGLAETQARYALYVDVVPKVIAAEAVSVIKGELYLVDGYTLARLDDLEDHPFDYRRELVPVTREDGSTALAWLYFHPQAGAELVAGGDLLAWLADQQEDTITAL